MLCASPYFIKPGTPRLSQKSSLNVVVNDISKCLFSHVFHKMCTHISLQLALKRLNYSSFFLLLLLPSSTSSSSSSFFFLLLSSSSSGMFLYSAVTLFSTCRTIKELQQNYKIAPFV